VLMGLSVESMATPTADDENPVESERPPVAARHPRIQLADLAGATLSVPMDRQVKGSGAAARTLERTSTLAQLLTR
jgi:hypothetical protein